jgi:hypothetical protein
MNGFLKVDSTLLTGVSMETGCYIDGSHISSIDFALAVIDFAINNGFEIDIEQYNKDKEWLSSDEDEEDKYLDIVDALDWTYQDAIDFLNDTAPDNLIWTVEDQSLFLEEADD